MRKQDAIGIGLSGLCMVHCLALPVLLSLAPALAWMENEWIHLALASLALVVGVFAMRTWVGGTRGLILRCLAAAGIGILFYGALAEVPELTERGITVAGASMLALAHTLAWLSARPDRTHLH
jgi:hypothetical protein